ncbi:hypothetical protein ACS0TY_011788 [Phlomoides rotata]
MGEVDEYFLAMESVQKVVIKGELNIYLEELPEKYVKNFDILDWWRKYSIRYPILSSIDKDVLSIQSSTAFNTGLKNDPQVDEAVFSRSSLDC